MKKLIASLALMGVFVTQSNAQDGGIFFNNIGPGFEAAVLDTDGTFAEGSGFSVQAYFAPAGTTDPGEFMATGPVVGLGTGFNGGVLDSAPVITIPGIGVGQMAALQLRAWNNNDGQYASYEEAVANEGIVGESIIFDSLALGDPLGSTDMIPLMVGLGNNNFQLAMIPEPSTVALGIIGGLALLLRRRK